MVTASTGNHGAATAWAAERTGVRAIVYVPRARARPSWRCSSGSAPSCARRAPTSTRPRTRARPCRREGLPFFEDGAEPAQFDGYAAIGREIVEQLGERPALTVVPVGNGALLIGVGARLGRGASASSPRRRR